MSSLTFRRTGKETLTTVVHAVESGDVYSTEVQPLANDLIERRYGGGDEAQSVEELVLHDGLGVTPGSDGHILARPIIPNIRPASAFGKTDEPKAPSFLIFIISSSTSQLQMFHLML
ncbi:hypothetical protein EYF80_004649 [Liparis tanakae]|uniref:Uncharacterized protein n=1 Tax=Liparis tanakae TaxID=230148 RepID=A0A4Z2J3S8_9TELE|nr:hypothetical protein EYF80_004649 [Liparis tanakae]